MGTTLLLCFLQLASTFFQIAKGFSYLPTTSNIRFGISTNLNANNNVAGSFWDFNGLSDRFYQLDEREDKEECITEIQLKQNYAAIIGDTDGPVPVEASGSWALIDGKFKMSITRKFESVGQKKGLMSEPTVKVTPTSQAIKTDIGEFTFDVVRTYTGSVSKVGEKIAVEGVIHLVDDVLGDEEVGYFSLIDTTEDRNVM